MKYLSCLLAMFIVLGLASAANAQDITEVKFYLYTLDNPNEPPEQGLRADAQPTVDVTVRVPTGGVVPSTAVHNGPCTGQSVVGLLCVDTSRARTTMRSAVSKQRVRARLRRAR